MSNIYGYEDVDEDVEFSEEDDENEDEDDEFGAHDLKRHFRSATTAMEQNQGEFQKPEVLYDFLYKFRHIASHATEDTGDTLLHIAIDLVKYRPDVRSGNMKPLIQNLLKENPQLLKTMNMKQQTPLYMAVSSRKWVLVESMTEGCSAYPKWRSALEDALEMPCDQDQKKTCLHIAFERDLRAKAIESLVNFARDRAFAAQDITGKTPLHYAVDYSQLTAARVNLIGLFIERDKRALATRMSRDTASPVETFLDLVDLRGNSVYRQHQESYEKFQMEELKVPSHKVDFGNSGLEGPKSLKEDDAVVRETHRKKEDMRNSGIEGKESPRREEQGAKAIEGSGSYQRNIGRAENLPDIKLQRRSRPGETEAEQKLIKVKRVPRTKADDSEAMAQNSLVILHRLKLHYMRTRPAEMALSFLYGKNLDDVQISFEYHGLPLEIKDRAFETAFAAMKFDDILKYVSFPPVRVTRTGRQSLRAPGSGQGRQDMEFFFEWLYMKGVRRIISVHVEDLEMPAHSDESIVSSLGRITVDNLDWQRLDLDPLSIRKICSKELRLVNLYWSGNNAVLRAWSESEGLPMLPKLTTIRLHVPSVDETLDSVYWMEANLEEFQKRMFANMKKRLQTPEEDEKIDNSKAIENAPAPADLHIIILRARGQKDGDIDPQRASRVKDTVASHRWLDSIDKFAEVIAPFWYKIRSDFFSAKKNSRGKGVIEDVVIALIDDGVDVFADELSGQIVGGRTFDDGKPYYISESGHGTTMASMILRVCPMAKLYPIRLKIIPMDDGGSHFDLKSAALAIQAALDKNATIISMSWSFPISKSNSQDRELMDAVLQRACSNNVLMFCSVSDQGNYEMMDYPAAYKPDSFFRIGPAGDDGRAFNLSGSLGAVDFLFPSAEVIKLHDSDSPRQSGDKDIRLETMTGSSVPTALGAGLAATILYLFKASALANETRYSEEHEPHKQDKYVQADLTLRLLRPDQMRATFQNLGTVTEYRFIKVWETLESAAEVLQDPLNSGQQTIDSINELCWTLVGPRAGAGD